MSARSSRASPAGGSPGVSSSRSALAFGLSIAAAPYEMTRYYSMRDVSTVRYAIGISMVAQVLIGVERDDPRHRDARHFPFLPSPDQASSIMASTVMSPLLGALFLVAMLSAIMSTVNSILLVTGGAFAHDLYKRLVNRTPSRAGWCGSTGCRSSRWDRPVLVRDAAARRRADHRDRAGEIHRQLLLRPVVLGSTGVAAREKARSGVWWPGSSGACSGRLRSSAASPHTASTRWKSASPERGTFISSAGRRRRRRRRTCDLLRRDREDLKFSVVPRFARFSGSLLRLGCWE